MPKTLATWRMSELSARQIAYLAKTLGLTKTEVLTVALDRLYQQETQAGQAQEPNEESPNQTEQ